MDFLEIYFATNRVPLRGKYGDFLLNLDWWKCLAIRCCSLSAVSHVSVGYKGVILNPRITGNCYHARTPFIDHYPTLCAVFIVPVKYAIDLSYYEYGVSVKKKSYPTITRFIMGGSTWNEDCLCMALSCLLAAGVPVNPNICTPVGLYRWLKKRGLRHSSDIHERNTGRLRASARQLIADSEAGRNLQA